MRALFRLVLVIAILFSAFASAKDGKPIDDGDLLRAVQFSLDCIQQAEPHEQNGHTTEEHRKLHPVFWGCYDWHASVFNHWAVLRVLNFSPEIRGRTKMIELLDRQFNREDLQVELENLTAEPLIVNYELGWFLKLVEEIHVSKLPQAESWRRDFAPLAAKASKMFREYLKTAEPTNSSLHFNTAYSMIHALDYAETVSDEPLKQAVLKAARQFYLADTDCDLVDETRNGGFIGHCFTSASLMSRVLPEGEFTTWFNKFLPQLNKANKECAHCPIDLLSIVAPQPGDFYSHHAVGKMFQKSVAMFNCAQALRAEQAPYLRKLYEAANTHSFTGRLILAGTVTEYGYQASHWLGAFAIHSYTALPDGRWKNGR